MDELELTLMERRLSNRQILQPMLETFEEQQNIRVHTQLLQWAGGRSDLIKVALYHHGPDISEIGTTWISDLVAMNALRPFSKSEIDQLTRSGAFIPAAWKTSSMEDDEQIWSIPWLAESLLLYYHNDLLEAAGVNPSTAFKTLDSMYETVQHLKSRGYSLPIAVPPPNDRNLLLHIASTWVWGSGGEYVSPDGKQVIFNEAKAVEGFTSFFKLLLSIPLEGTGMLEQSGVAECFLQKKTPVAIGGVWLLPDLSQEVNNPNMNCTVTRLPGQPFVGGSNLVIWKHTRQDRAALSLIRYLTEHKQASVYGRASGILSARSQTFTDQSYENDQILKTVYESIMAGRSFPTIPLWGLVEDRLSTAVSAIWQTLSINPDLNIDETISRTLNQIARSLNLTLSQR
jgi:multiple sugar transport system substrate-binding protein